MVNAIQATVFLFSGWSFHTAAAEGGRHGNSGFISHVLWGCEKAPILNNYQRRLMSHRCTPSNQVLTLAKRKETCEDSVPNISSKRRRSWEESYELLCAYKEKYCHHDISQSDKPLGPWINRQRIEHAKYLLREEMIRDRGWDTSVGGRKLPSTSMTAERKKLLDEFGFVWDAMGQTWDTRYDELCEFRRLNGHCVVPRSNGRLGAWVEKQRIEYKKYQQAKHDDDRKEGSDTPTSILTEARVMRLNDIGFVWDVREKQFEQKLGQLRIFKEMNGHIDPRFMNGSLALWVRKYRQQYRKYLDASARKNVDSEVLSSILPENRRLALENVGFSASMFDEPRTRPVGNRRASWEERYEELDEYKAEHGHCLVPKNYGPLGSWVRAQRHVMKEKGDMGSPFEDGGQLSNERVQRLNRLGFVWDVHQWQWDQAYNELLQFKEKHNHTNVPMSYGGLGLWVFNQRSDYNAFRKAKQSGMTPARLELLQNIGFVFDLGQRITSEADERWQARLNELKEYEEKWGTFQVKQSHNLTLYNWCQHQRAMLQRKQLKKEREDALRSLGFLNPTD